MPGQVIGLRVKSKNWVVGVNETCHQRVVCSVAGRNGPVVILRAKVSEVNELLWANTMPTNVDVRTA